MVLIAVNLGLMAGVHPTDAPARNRNFVELNPIYSIARFFTLIQNQSNQIVSHPATIFQGRLKTG